jgi:hypothetical protein
VTTATRKKPAAPSVELRKLERARDEAHAKAREARTKMESWDLETERLRAQSTRHANAHPEEFEGAELRVKPGTAAAKLAATIRERREQPNPHEAAYAAARDEFHRRDEVANAFKTRHLAARVAEHDPTHVEAQEMIRAGFDQVARGCELYRVGREEVLGVILATPRKNGQDLGDDPRIKEWVKLAAEVRDGEIVPPHSVSIKLGAHDE